MKTIFLLLLTGISFSAVAQKDSLLSTKDTLTGNNQEVVVKGKTHWFSINWIKQSSTLQPTLYHKAAMFLKCCKKAPASA